MKKRLHHNGVLIGEFDFTGDDIRDVEIVDKLLAERGPKQAATLERSMFNQANSFASASADIFEKHLLKTPPNGAAMSPFVVNIAFSIELFIKTLSVQHGKTLHGHEIKKLFKKLPGAAKDEIGHHLGRLCTTSQWADEIKTMDELRNVLDEINTAFIDWRYLHENPTKRLKITFKPAIFLSEILHAACAENLVKGMTSKNQ
ncbi:hypothetical protein QA633_23905 [Bradyrhizobium barranii]|uniref:hypothetical protein n=1 Tax=Bradyrhizobium barranii TaxID=2992140 RepID=UPI0024AF5E21|nr:hypothetical protein [Bradyrhizobium barranii]WFT91411.1 hypothetical protein QA633_23905 [Bradyrhizobium barranii]